MPIDTPLLLAAILLVAAVVAAVAMFVRASDLNHPLVIDAAHLAHQAEWSERTFGPGDRHRGVRDHILMELAEAEDDPTEWVDVIILAFDGAWRAGLSPQAIIDGVIQKQMLNEGRTWPDWRTADPDRAIEHVREP